GAGVHEPCRGARRERRSPPGHLPRLGQGPADRVDPQARRAERGRLRPRGQGRPGVRVVTFDLRESRQLLAGTPGALGAALGGLSDAWLLADEGPGTWTPWQVLAHLTHVEERDWLGRISTIMEHGP